MLTHRFAKALYVFLSRIWQLNGVGVATTNRVMVEGFGELFRQVSYQQIGTSTIQSRAFAGLSNKTIIFGVPGSTNACQTAWHEVIREQLDASHRPCNFVAQLKTADLESCGTRG